MSSGGDRSLGAEGAGSRFIRRNASRSRGQRGEQQGRSRGGGRFRRLRVFRHGGSGRGRRAPLNRDVRRQHILVEWLQRLESEGPDAFFDFALCFANMGIPYLETMAYDLRDLGCVAGEEIQAILMAAVLSMCLGREVHPDGSVGRRIRRSVIEAEWARVNAGG